MNNFKKILFALKSAWMKFAAAVGWFNTRLLLTVMYVAIFGTVGIILKLLRKDLLRTRWNPPSYWRDKKMPDHMTPDHLMEDARHQF